MLDDGGGGGTDIESSIYHIWAAVGYFLQRFMRNSVVVTTAYHLFYIKMTRSDKNL